MFRGLPAHSAKSCWENPASREGKEHKMTLGEDLDDILSSSSRECKSLICLFKEGLASVASMIYVQKITLDLPQLERILTLLTERFSNPFPHILE